MSIINMIDIMDSRFDDIAPLNDNEVKQTIEELLVDPGFIHAVQYVIPNLEWSDFSAEMRQYNTKFDFQNRMISPVIWGVSRKTSSTITSGGWENLSTTDQHLFLSNHRDIILDAGILNILRNEKGLETTEIAIGDNLLIHPWIKKLVRLNKSFIVQRGVSVRQMLQVSKQLSEYIHYAIKEKNESVWLAQREGRAKDANDRTQESLLKMLALSPERGSFIDNIKDLNIIPLSISYEYDPCDYLKAQEFQLKRDNPEYKKTQRDDLLNMETGLLGYKGAIHFQFGAPINPELNQIHAIEKKTQIELVAKCIDRDIHRNYFIFPCNYIAFDLLNNSKQFQDKYTKEEIDSFEMYLEGQMNKIVIDDKDHSFLREKLLAMYSNTLKNYLVATGEV